MSKRLNFGHAVGRAGLLALVLAVAGPVTAQEQLPWQRTQARSGDTYQPDYPSRPSDAYRAPADDGYRPAPPRADDAYRPQSPPADRGYVDNYRSGRGYTSDAGPNGYGQPYTQGLPPDDGYERAPPPRSSSYDDRGPRRPPPPSEDGTYSQGEISAAGHRFFGSISQGLASVIEHAFKRSGRPNGYVLGEDAGGAFVAGLRYGEGVLYTKDAGNHKVYWQGPSLGYDFGAEGSKTMVLVYNLRDPSEIYHRFGGVQGSAYVVGGVSIQYQQYGDVILAPIRSGVGLRLGANVGYLKYTRSPTWNPF